MGENGWEDGGIQKTRITPEGFRHFYPSKCRYEKDGLEPGSEVAVDKSHQAAIRRSSQPQLGARSPGAVGTFSSRV